MEAQVAVWGARWTWPPQGEMHTRAVNQNKKFLVSEDEAIPSLQKRKRKKNMEPGAVAHTCNPSYL
jgi:hypothetical protein